MPIALDQRQVQRLRVRASAASPARRFAIAFEDALRTTSLPPEAGYGWVAIRELKLGRVSHDLSGMALSLRLHDAMMRSMSQAVDVRHPEAARAAVVVAPSRLAALTALAGLWVRRESGTEWFWERLIPGWRQAPTREEQWERLMEAAGDGDEGPAVVAQVVTAVLTRYPAATRQVLDAVRPGVARRWLVRMGVDTGALEQGSEGVSNGSPLSGVSETAWRAVEQWVVEQRRATGIPPAAPVASTFTVVNDLLFPALWVGVCLAWATQGPGDPGPVLARRLGRRLREAMVEADRPSIDTLWSETGRAGTPSGPESEDPVARIHAASGAPIMPSADAISRSIDLAASHDPGPWEETNYAGLFFFCRPLLRLGWRKRHGGERGTMVPTLLHLGVELGMSLDDPVAQGLVSLLGAPPANSDPLLRRPAELSRWKAALRRWLRVHAGLTLADVAIRRGQLRREHPYWTIHFEPAQAETALRRAGLDTDLGYLPEISGVVHFFYTHCHERTSIRA